MISILCLQKYGFFLKYKKKRHIFWRNENFVLPLHRIFGKGFTLESVFLRKMRCNMEAG